MMAKGYGIFLEVIIIFLKLPVVKVAQICECIIKTIELYT